MKFYCNSFAWTVYLIAKEFFACCSSVSLSVFLSQEKIVSQTHNTCLTKYFHGIILFWVVPLLELLKIFYYTQLIRYEVTLEDIYWKLLCGEIIYNYLYRNHSNIGNINMYVMHIHLTDITMSAIFMRNLWMKLWRKPLYQNNVFQDCPCLAPLGCFETIWQPLVQLHSAAYIVQNSVRHVLFCLPARSLERFQCFPCQSFRWCY